MADTSTSKPSPVRVGRLFTNGVYDADEHRYVLASDYEKLERELVELRGKLDAPAPTPAPLERDEWTPRHAIEFYAAGRHFDVVNGRTRILDTGAIASDALKQLSLEYAAIKGLTESESLSSKARAEHWSVSVEADAQTLLTISSQHVGGVELSDEQEAVVENAAHHLLAFIGRAHEPPARTAPPISKQALVDALIAAAARRAANGVHNQDLYEAERAARNAVLLVLEPRGAPAYGCRNCDETFPSLTERNAHQASCSGRPEPRGRVE